MSLRVSEWRQKVVSPGWAEKEPSPAPPNATQKARVGQARPYTAGPAAHALRPIGKAPIASGATRDAAKPRMHPAQNDRTYISSLKAEVLLVQRHIDEMSQEGKVIEVSPEMQNLEQRLLHIQYDPDPLKFTQAQSNLLELLLLTLRRLASALLAKTKGSDVMRIQTPTTPQGRADSSTFEVQNNMIRPHTAPSRGGRMADGSCVALASSISEPFVDLAQAVPVLLDRSRQTAWMGDAATPDAETSRGAHMCAPASPVKMPEDTSTMKSTELSPQAHALQLQRLLAQQERLQQTLNNHLRAAGVSMSEQATIQTQTDPLRSDTPLTSSPSFTKHPTPTPGSSKPPTPLPTISPKKPPGKGGKVGLDHPTDRVESLMKEKDQLESRLKQLTDQLSDSSQAMAIAFADVDHQKLERYGIRPPSPIRRFDPATAEGMLTAIRAAMDKASDVGSDNQSVADTAVTSDKRRTPPPQKSRKEDDDRTPEMLSLMVSQAQLYAALVAQNKTVVSLTETISGLEEGMRATREAGRRDSVMQTATIESLRDQLAEKENEFIRELAARNGELEEAKREVAALRDQCISMEAARCEKPASMIRNSDLPGESVQKEDSKQFQRLKSDYTRLQLESESLTRQLRAARETIAGAQRDNTALRQRIKERELEIESARQEAKSLEDKVREANAAAERAKEFSDKVLLTKEEDADALRKISIELNIARSTVDALRQREEDAVSKVRAVEWKYKHVKETLEKVEKERLAEMAEAQHKADELEISVEVYRKELLSAKQLVDQLREEIAQLRQTEQRLQGLQKDFENYTMCKIRQGEAAEEDERVMQECLQMLASDFFVLPDHQMSSEDVELMIDRLHEKKVKLEAEQRQQERQVQKKSIKLQIADVLKRRMNTIQLFAFERKRTAIQQDATIQQLREKLRVEQEALKAAAEKRKELEVAVEHLGERINYITQEKDRGKAESAELTERVRDLENKVHHLTGVVRQQQQELAEAGTKLEEKQQTLSRVLREAPGSLASPSQSTVLPLHGDGAETASDDEEQGDRDDDDLVDETIHPALRP